MYILHATYQDAEGNTLVFPVFVNDDGEIIKS